MAVRVQLLTLFFLVSIINCCSIMAIILLLDKISRQYFCFSLKFEQKKRGNPKESNVTGPKKISLKVDSLTDILHKGTTSPSVFWVVSQRIFGFLCLSSCLVLGVPVECTCYNVSFFVLTLNLWFLIYNIRK